MGNMLETGQAWLASKLKAHASKEIAYLRGGEQKAIQATIGRTLMKLSDGLGGVRMEWTDRDFIVTAVDLGSFNEPQQGDKIMEIDGAVTRTYEVMAPGNEPPWRWSDPFHVLMRIHTKEVHG